MPRANGFYWIKMGDGKWQVWEYDNGDFFRNGGTYHESLFIHHQIGERILTPDEIKNQKPK